MSAHEQDLNEMIAVLNTRLEGRHIEATEQSRQIGDLKRELAEAEADRDRARDAAVALEQELAAARALHHSPKGALCVECCEDWPCATIEALGGETP